jgi:predicted ATPase
MAKNYSNKKLTQVMIRGYKSISYDSPVTMKLGKVNILLGANGAGKSNIISFFRSIHYLHGVQLAYKEA